MGAAPPTPGVLGKGLLPSPLPLPEDAACGLCLRVGEGPEDLASLALLRESRSNDTPADMALRGFFPNVSTGTKEGNWEDAWGCAGRVRCDRPLTQPGRVLGSPTQARRAASAPPTRVAELRVGLQGFFLLVGPLLPKPFRITWELLKDRFWPGPQGFESSIWSKECECLFACVRVCMCACVYEICPRALIKVSPGVC